MVSFSGGSVTQVNTTTTKVDRLGSSVTVLSNGNSVVTWTAYNQDGSGAGIYQQVYASDGSKVGGETKVNAVTANNQLASSVTALTNGKWVVTWQSLAQDGSDYGVYQRVYNADGTTSGADVLVNTTTANHQAGSVVKGLPDGGWIVVFESIGASPDIQSVYVQRYNADGTKNGAQTLVNTTTKDVQNLATVSTLSGGGWVIAWSSAGQEGSGTGIYFQRYNANGTKAGVETLANTTKLNDQTDASVVGLSDGRFVITWTENGGRDGHVAGVYSQIFNADGSKSGLEFQVNTTTNGNQMTSETVALANGGWVVVYYSSETEKSGILYQVFNADGTKSGAEVRVNAVADSHQTQPDIAATADGGFIITWTNGLSEIDSRKYTPANTLPTADDKTVSLSEDGSYTFQQGDFSFADSDGDTLASIKITELPANGVLKLNGVLVTVNQVISASDISKLVWVPGSNANGDGLAHLTFTVTDSNGGTSADGHTITFNVAPTGEIPGYVGGAETTVNTYTSGDQIQASSEQLADGGWVITWTSRYQDGSGYGVYQQAYNADGTPLGTENRVNTVTTSDQTEPVVSILSNGGWVVAWTSLNQDGNSYGIYSQAYNSDGTKSGLETPVNTYTTSQQTQPRIISLSSGGWVVTWSSLGQDGDGWGVYSQKFNADGTKDGDEFRVNTTTAGEQSTSAVAALAGGGWVTAYQSANVDGDGYGVVLQQFDSSGNKIGGEVLVNTYTTSDQVDPSVTGLKNGGWVVTWSSSGKDGSGLGVYGQIYNPDGSKSGTEFQIHSTTAGNQNESNITVLSDGNFVVTWTSAGQDGSGYGVYAQAFRADGTKIDGEVLVNVTTASDQLWSEVTALPDGGYVVSWTSTASGASNIQSRKFTPSNTLPNGADKTITIDEDGHHAFAAADFGFTDGDGDDLASATIVTLPGNGILKLDGKLVTAGQVVSAADIAKLQWFPGGDANGAGLADFTFKVTDTMGGTSDAVHHITFDVTAVAEIPGFNGDDIVKVNTTPVGDRLNSSVTGLDSGGYVVTWTAYGQDANQGGIFQQIYNADGTRDGGETRVNAYEAGNQDNSSVTALADGGWVVTWRSQGQDGSDYGVYQRVYAADGSTSGLDILVNTTTLNHQYDAVVKALPDGGWIVAFASIGDATDIQSVYLQRFNADGSKNGTQSLVNTTTANAQDGTALALLEGGGWVVSWTSLNQDGGGKGVYFQQFNADGSKHGGETLANTTTANSQYDSSVAGLSDGRFVLTWTEDGGRDGHVSGIYSQVFNADGTKSGSEFRVNTDTAGNQYTSETVALSTGGWVVVYSSSEGQKAGVDYQVFNADGTKNGDEVRINAFPESHQWQPDIAATADGGFVVSWSNGFSEIDSRVYSIKTAAPTTADKAVTIVEDGKYTFNVADFAFNDPDDAPMKGIRIATLPAKGVLKLDGAAVTAGQTIKVADIGKLVWTPAADANGTALSSFTFKVVDASGTPSDAAKTFTFNVLSVNDAPTGADKTVTILEDGNYKFAAADFGFGDSDGNSLAGVKISALPGNGTLKLNGANVTVGQQIAVADFGKLVWAPAANASGNGLATIKFQVVDNGGTANGGTDTDQTANTITFNVTPVKEPPQGTDKTVTVDEDTAYKFAAKDFGFVDPDGGTLASIKINTLPKEGLLTLGGKAVTANQVIAAADIAKLAWTPDEDDAGAGLAKFTFQVTKTGTGLVTDPTPNTITINVTEETDTFRGTSKANILVGTKFGDILDGKAGNDTLTGKGGADTFVFKTGYDRDTITDFTAKGTGHDILDLTKVASIDNFADLKANHLSTHGADVWIDAGQDDVIILKGVKIADLDAGDFLF